MSQKELTQLIALVASRSAGKLRQADLSLDGGEIGISERKAGGHWQEVLALKRVGNKWVVIRDKISGE